MTDDPKPELIFEGFNISLEKEAFVRAYDWQGFLTIEFIPFSHKKARKLVKALSEYIEESSLEAEKQKE